MNQLCEEAERFLNEKEGSGEKEQDEATFSSLLQSTGLELDPAGEGSEPPPEDQAHLFAHHAFSGNGGISGQKIVRS